MGKYCQKESKYVITNCTSGYEAAEKNPSFLFPKDQELWRKWIYFINHKDLIPTKYSAVCIDHYEEKLMKHWQRSM